MIGVAVIVFVGLFVMSVLVLTLSRSASLDYQAVRTRLRQPGAETLAYDVPDGQDAAELIVALGHAGYTAIEDDDAGTHRVLVFCPGGRQDARSRVRAVLEGAGVRGPSTIRFADER
jgi:hypothetical protein